MFEFEYIMNMKSGIEINREYFHQLQYFLLKKSQQSINISPETKTRSKISSDEENFLRCATCKYPITQETDRIHINEKHEHVFANPDGYVFHIGCFAKAPGCFVYGEKTSYFTWFPGYTWQMAICAQCVHLLGWAYQSHEHQFYGLIVDKLISGQAKVE